MKADRFQLRRRIRPRRTILARHDRNSNRLTGFNRGSLDTTFGTNGKASIDWTGRQDLVHSVLIQPDGKIVLGGTGTNGSNKFNFLLARFNTNGTLDNTFGASGVVGTDFGASGDEPWGLAIQANGKLVASGATNSGGDEIKVTRAIYDLFCVIHPIDLPGERKRS